MSDHTQNPHLRPLGPAPKQEEVFGTPYHFLKWAKKNKPREEVYNYSDAKNCAVAQYAQAHLPKTDGAAGGCSYLGGTNPTHVAFKDTSLPVFCIDGRIEELSVRNGGFGPRTWGGLIDLLEAYFGEQEDG